MAHPKGKYAWTVKIGEKGQFVIPKEARELFDFHPGDTIIMLADEKKGIAIPPKSLLSKLAEKIFEDGGGTENQDDNFCPSVPESRPEPGSAEPANPPNPLRKDGHENDSSGS